MAQSRELSGGFLAFLLLWPVLVVVAAGYLLLGRLDASIAAQMDFRPPLVLVDEDAMIAAHVAGGATQAVAIERVSQTAQKLAGRGYVVVSTRLLLSAPDAMVVRE